MPCRYDDDLLMSVRYDNNSNVVNKQTAPLSRIVRQR